MSIKMAVDIEALKTRTKALEEKLVKAIEGAPHAFEERLKELESAIETRVGAIEQKLRISKT